jgi:hypothetical protein
MKPLFLPCILCLFAWGSPLPADAQTVAIKWGGDALAIYDSGFANTVMKNPGGGVRLFNMDLVENDSPGSGQSEKGVYLDAVWGKNHARKVFMLDDPRAAKAWILVFAGRQGKTPLTFVVNGGSQRDRGHTGSVANWDNREAEEYFRWAEFPAEWLKKGANTIDFSCPEAAREEDGWTIQLSRADEFETGGGDPSNVGKTSFKSTDGGETWKESPFGPLGQTRAEYTIRLSLDRSVKTGWLETPVIDLWRGDATDFIVPLRMIRSFALTIESTCPEGTKVEYFLRKGTAPGPYSNEWAPYEFVGAGSSLNLQLPGAQVNRRYVQVRAVLSTSNPLETPVVRSIRVAAEHQENIPLPKNIHLLEVVNPPIRYSSIPWEWEVWDRPEFPELRQWQNLDKVIEGSTNEFEAQVKLMQHAIKQWIDGGVEPEFPEWNALSILNHINQTGGGGMCLQNNLLLAGFYLSYGWQARHVNAGPHEVCEVWNDEFGKWIYLDAHRAGHYFYDAATSEPMSVYDIHVAYLNKYFPNRPIDWMKDKIAYPLDGHPYAERGSLTHHGGHTFDEYCRPAFTRMVPRDNWFSKPFPKPLNHGMTQWPWNGYINFYDDRTPPKRQYSHFTDRPRDMWPDLNLVHIDATTGYGNDCLYLRFETFTPNFSHFEVDVNDNGWVKASEHYTWLLQSGRNTLRARAVNKLGAKGKPSTVTLNHADAPFGE